MGATYSTTNDFFADNKGNNFATLDSCFKGEYDRNGPKTCTQFQCVSQLNDANLVDGSQLYKNFCQNDNDATCKEHADYQTTQNVTIVSCANILDTSQMQKLQEAVNMGKLVAVSGSNPTGSTYTFRQGTVRISN